MMKQRGKRRVSAIYQHLLEQDAARRRQLENEMGRSPKAPPHPIDIIELIQLTGIRLDPCPNDSLVFHRSSPRCRQPGSMSALRHRIG